MYDWTLSLAHRKHATWALAFISFSESIWFPIPPDVLQIALTLERPKRAWFYAFINTVASVAGGVVGYLIGMFAIGIVAKFFDPARFEPLRQYADNIWLLTAGAVAIHPYKIFTIGAGFLKVNFLTFVLASVIGRGPRFFIIGALLYFFGEPAKRFIDKYFNLITVIATVLIIGAVIAIVVYQGTHPSPSSSPSPTPTTQVETK